MSLVAPGSQIPPGSPNLFTTDWSVFALVWGGNKLHLVRSPDGESWGEPIYLEGSGGEWPLAAFMSNDRLTVWSREGFKCLRSLTYRVTPDACDLIHRRVWLKNVINAAVAWDGDRFHVVAACGLDWRGAASLVLLNAAPEQDDEVQVYPLADVQRVCALGLHLGPVNGRGAESSRQLLVTHSHGAGLSLRVAVYNLSARTYHFQRPVPVEEPVAYTHQLDTWQEGVIDEAGRLELVIQRGDRLFSLRRNGFNDYTPPVPLYSSVNNFTVARSPQGDLYVLFNSFEANHQNEVYLSKRLVHGRMAGRWQGVDFAAEGLFPSAQPVVKDGQLTFLYSNDEGVQYRSLLVDALPQPVVAERQAGQQLYVAKPLQGVASAGGAPPGPLSNLVLTPDPPIGVMHMSWTNGTGTAGSLVEFSEANAGKWITLYNGTSIVNWQALPPPTVPYDYRVTPLAADGTPGTPVYAMDRTLDLFLAKYGIWLTDCYDPTKRVVFGAFGTKNDDTGSEALAWARQEDVFRFTPKGSKRPSTTFGPTGWYQVTGVTFWVPDYDEGAGGTLSGKQVHDQIEEFYDRQTPLFYRDPSGLRLYTTLGNHVKAKDSDVHFAITLDIYESKVPPAPYNIGGLLAT